MILDTIKNITRFFWEETMLPVLRWSLWDERLVRAPWSKRMFNSLDNVFKKIIKRLKQSTGLVTFPFYAATLAIFIMASLSSFFNDYWGTFRVSIPFVLLYSFSDTLYEKTIKNKNPNLSKVPGSVSHQSV